MVHLMPAAPGGCVPPARQTRLIPLFALLAGVAGVANNSLAQLVPDRLYYGVNRTIPMTVTVPAPAPKPAGTPAEVTLRKDEGSLADATQPEPDQADADEAEAPALPAPTTIDVRIDLFDPRDENAGAVASAPVMAGAVDLAALFPVLWTSPRPTLRYAQLVVAGVEVGPPVVLQPLLEAPAAVLLNPRNRTVYFNDPQKERPNFDASQGILQWVSEPPAYSGIRAYVDQHVRFITSAGEIDFRLLPQYAPNTVFNFRELVAGGFYTDIPVHRIVNKLPTDGQPFVFQFGDPTGTGAGGPGYTIALEPSTLPHDFGVLSMARESEPDTGGSQVFVALSRQGTMSLDGKYTAFGEAVAGAETILAIARTPVVNMRPPTPPTIRRAELIDAPPYSKRPPRVTRPADEPTRR